MAGRTTIAIAHRLSTILSADVIFALDRRPAGRAGHPRRAARPRRALRAALRRAVRRRRGRGPLRGRRPVRRRPGDGAATAGGVTPGVRHLCWRRLPPCQSSWTPTSSVLTPSAGSWGRSRRLRLSSANPGKRARPTTWSHSSPACSSDGSRLITGPKNARPSGGSSCRIGVPTSLPVAASASSVSAWIVASQAVSSRASTSVGRQPGGLEDRGDEVRGAAALAVGGGVRRRRAARRSLAHRRVEPADGVAAVLVAGARRHPQQAQARGVAGLVLGRELGVVVDVGVEQPQRDEPPVDGQVALGRHRPQPLARQPAERADGVEVEPDGGHAGTPFGWTTDLIASRSRRAASRAPSASSRSWCEVTISSSAPPPRPPARSPRGRRGRSGRCP